VRVVPLDCHAAVQRGDSLRPTELSRDFRKSLLDLITAADLRVTRRPAAIGNQTVCSLNSALRYQLVTSSVMRPQILHRAYRRSRDTKKRAVLRATGKSNRARSYYREDASIEHAEVVFHEVVQVRRDTIK
jgi:hypothetical protein